MPSPTEKPWVIKRGVRAATSASGSRTYIIAAITYDPSTVKGDPMCRLRKVIEEDLGWRAVMPCLAGCGSLLRYSVLDSIELSDAGVRCPGCNSAATGYLRFNTRGQYGIFFQEAVLLAAMVVADKTESFIGSAVALAHTALEIFLLDIVEFQRQERKLDKEIDLARANVVTYRDWLKDTEIISAEQAKALKNLEAVSGWRNDFMHRGRGADVERAIVSCEDIAKIFNELSHLLPAGDPCLGELEEV